MEERGNLPPKANPPNQEAVAPPAVASEPPPAKKRKTEVGRFQNTPYFKIRCIVQGLRPLFLEVLRTPDFQNSSAAHHIQTQMKTMLELLKQLNADVTSAEEEAARNQCGEAPLQEAKLAEVTEFAKQLEEVAQGSYMIGGSPVGWNFCAYPGSKPLYYGVTKASVLSRRAAK